MYLKREGYRPQTIERQIRCLKQLPLANPETAKSSLASKSWSEGVKELAASALSNYYKSIKVPFQKPIFRRIEKIPFLPQEEEIINLIAELSPTQAAFCQFLRETGCRAGEAFNIIWSDINNGVVNIVPEKHSKPRSFKVSPKLLLMINSLPRKTNRVWGKCKSLEYFSSFYFKQRKEIATQLGNPRIKSIHYHTFRHLKASQEYHKTRDLVHVQRMLGHRSISSTLKYIQLAQFENDEFVCKAAKNIEEASQLVEAGFDYITEIDGMRLFRKRK